MPSMGRKPYPVTKEPNPKSKCPFQVKKTRGVCHNTVAMPFTFKSISRQKKKKNNGNSNIYFTMQKYNLQKNPLKETKNPSRY
jgi:hypothetical protein